MPKAKTTTLSVKLPPKKARIEFLTIYELYGCIKAVNFLTSYYKIPKMKIILNGRMVGKRKTNRIIACYTSKKAFFTKEGLEKRTVLHEFYHHLVESKNVEIALSKEEREANQYAKSFNLSSISTI